MDNIHRAVDLKRLCGIVIPVIGMPDNTHDTADDRVHLAFWRLSTDELHAVDALLRAAGWIHGEDYLASPGNGIFYFHYEGALYTSVPPEELFEAQRKRADRAKIFAVDEHLGMFGE